MQQRKAGVVAVTKTRAPNPLAFVLLRLCCESIPQAQTLANGWQARDYETIVKP